jgi:hypothetical protein
MYHNYVITSYDASNNIKKCVYNIIIMISYITELINNIKQDDDFIFDIDKEKTYVERLRMTKIFELEHPDKIPVILQQSKKNIVRLNKKYLFFSIDKNYTIDNIKQKLKDSQIYDYTHLKISKSDNQIISEEYYDINFYVNGKFIYNDITLENLYSFYKDSDGLLKIISREPIAEQLIFDYPDYLPVIIDLDKTQRNTIKYWDSNRYDHKYKLIDPCTYIIYNNISILDLFHMLQKNNENNELAWLSIIDKKTNKYQSISYNNFSIDDIYSEYKDDDGFLRIYFLYNIDNIDILSFLKLK